MTKQKTPLLSLEAHGSLGGSVTYQGKGQRKIARTKPRLPYFLTLPTQYQRWLYADYIAQWNALTDTEKQVYRSAGARHHLTGLQEYMRYSLKYLPDIMGYWKLDANHAATTPDSSRYDSTATIIGASPAVGTIDGCLSFDGINDYLDLGTPSQCRLTTEISVEMFVTPLLLGGGWDALIAFENQHYELMLTSDRLSAFWKPTGGSVTLNATVLATLNQRYHLCATWDSSLPAANLKLYLDGALNTQANTTGEIDYGANTELYIARIPGQANYGPALIDQVAIYNRVLTPADILRHSLRRWPTE